MRRLVVLRPEAAGEATVAAARAAGLDAVSIPLFRVEPVAWQPPDPAGFDGLVVTSANALRHGGPGLAALRSLPVHAVGPVTAAAAEAAGFRVATAGHGNAADLIAARDDAGRWLHLAGEQHRDLPVAQTIVVYRAAPIDPPPDLAALDHALALVHSPRAGERLAALVGLERRPTIAIAAISAAAAAACGEGWSDLRWPDSPRSDALLALAGELCHKPAR